MPKKSIHLRVVHGVAATIIAGSVAQFLWGVVKDAFRYDDEIIVFVWFLAALSVGVIVATWGLKKGGSGPDA